MLGGEGDVYRFLEHVRAMKGVHWYTRVSRSRWEGRQHDTKRLDAGYCAPLHSIHSGDVMRAIVIMLATALCCGNASALVPHDISYQGYLTTAAGTPVNASVPMTIKLYNVPTAGVALYTETQTVLVINGLFNALIGSVTTLTLPFDVPYWLGITVGADPEMTPRQPVASAPYAIRSASTESLATTATVPATQITGSIGSAGNFTGPLAGDVTGTQSATAIASSTVTGKVLTGFAAGAGSVSASDTILTAINKLDGNNALKAPLAGPAFTGTVNAATLALTGNLNLLQSTASAGNIMKAGNRFIHNFGTQNTFIGESAGNFTLSGTSNTGVGFQALLSSTGGANNSAVGRSTLENNTSGFNNTAIGYAALFNNTDGHDNIAIGLGAGNGTGSSGVSNIMIGNDGLAGDGNTIRIGDAAKQTKTFVAGIRGAAVTNGLTVVIDSNGRLGTVAGVLAGYELVQTTTALPNPVNHGGAQAQCPAGKVPVGGGYSLPNGFATSQALTVVASYPFNTPAQTVPFPIPAAAGWIAAFNTNGGANSSLTVYAICVSTA